MKWASRNLNRNHCDWTSWGKAHPLKLSNLFWSGREDLYACIHILHNFTPLRCPAETWPLVKHVVCPVRDHLQQWHHFVVNLLRYFSSFFTFLLWQVVLWQKKCNKTIMMNQTHKGQHCIWLCIVKDDIINISLRSWLTLKMQPSGVVGRAAFSMLAAGGG